MTASGASTDAMVAPIADFLLLHGSQTGQATAITEDLEKDAAEMGVACRRMCMDQFKKVWECVSGVFAVHPPTARARSPFPWRPNAPPQPTSLSPPHPPRPENP